MPFMAVYAATKAFVTSFSEAIAEENRPFGIQIMALCPGSTKTNFFRASNIERPVQVKGQQTAEQVVDTAMRGIQGGRTKVVSGLTNFIGALIGKHVPNMITTRAIARSAARKISETMIRFTVLGSGSTGNAVLISTDKTNVLVDAGLERA